MFRDESSKVIQKAHAQWGIPGSPVQSDPGSSSQSPGPTTVVVLSPRRPPRRSTGSARPTPAVATQKTVASKIPRRVEPNLDQRGLNFYVERYLLNHPDSPKTPEVMDLYLGDDEAMRSVMIAVGLAGMSNLLGNKSMNMLARSKYITALKQTGQLIASASRDHKAIMKPLRSVVTLALFEVTIPTYLIHPLQPTG